MPIGAGVEDGAPHPPSLRFRPLTCEESSASDYDGMRSPALPHGVGRTVSGARVARSCMNPLRYNEEGLGRRTVASETACRTWLGLVHVDQLRRQTLRTTTSLVTRRFNSFAAPRRLGRGWLPGIEANPTPRAARPGPRAATSTSSQQRDRAAAATASTRPAHQEGNPYAAAIQAQPQPGRSG